MKFDTETPSSKTLGLITAGTITEDISYTQNYDGLCSCVIGLLALQRDIKEMILQRGVSLTAILHTVLIFSLPLFSSVGTILPILMMINVLVSIQNIQQSVFIW